MGQFCFSTLWLNVFTGLRVVVKGANTNSERLASDMDTTNVNKVLQWLRAEPEQTRTLALLDPEHENHEDVMSYLRDNLTAQEFTLMYSIKFNELQIQHRQDVAVATRRLAEREGLTPKLDPTKPSFEGAATKIVMQATVLSSFSKALYSDVGFKRQVENALKQAEFDGAYNSVTRTLPSSAPGSDKIFRRRFFCKVS